LLSNLWSNRTAALSAAERPLHREFTFVLTLLVLGLAWAWRSIFRLVHAKRIPPGRVAVARWGSFAWILILVFILTAPWRLLWHNDMPRILVGGERGYILAEGSDDIVIYNAQRGATESFRIAEAPPLVRLGTIGYVFETEEEFAAANSSR